MGKQYGDAISLSLRLPYAAACLRFRRVTVVRYFEFRFSTEVSLASDIQIRKLPWWAFQS